MKWKNTLKHKQTGNHYAKRNKSVTTDRKLYDPIYTKCFEICRDKKVGYWFPRVRNWRVGGVRVGDFSWVEVFFQG